MNPIEGSVSIHPYFKIRPGQHDAAQALLREFVAQTASEEKMLYYEFTLNGDIIFCREAYVGAEGALAHLTNVGAILKKMETASDLTRLEIHGPAAELEKLKGPLAALKVEWFAYQCGVTK
jgi:quinol monooxygenase YgiN